MDIILWAGLIFMWTGGFFCGWAFSVWRRVNARYRIKASLPEVNQMLPMPLTGVPMPSRRVRPDYTSTCQCDSKAVGPAPVSQAVPRPPKREKK